MMQASLASCWQLCSVSGQYAFLPHAQSNYDHLFLISMAQSGAELVGAADTAPAEEGDVERHFAIKINEAVREFEEDIAQTP
jgi:hypothetical protein